MIKVICKECGKEFEAKDSRQKYCSNECYRIASKRRARESYKKPEHKQHEMPVIKKESANNALVEMAIRAREAGMTYGKYVAMLYLQDMRKGKK